MAELTIGIADLGAELRRLPKRDQAAIRRGIQRTLEVDAPRWIQWSIRGGGMGGVPARTAPKKPSKPKTPKPRAGLLRRVLSRLKTLLSRLRGGRVPKKPGAGKMKPKDPCAPGAAPTGYRQPIDTGDYANSWKSEMLEDGGIFYNSGRPPIKAGVIEHGRRPAPIPIRPLADWVRRKLGCADPKRALGIAIAISKTAAKTPRKGLKVLERAHPKIVEAAHKNVDRELRKVKPGT